jgi:asparagine synthase (glutamine-hydrolysing)
MCGISGLISRHPISPDSHDRVRRINSSLRHRGPDGEGEYASNHVHLAMRRLAIIDLQGGWQPLYNEDKSIILVANGEVYNYVELQKDLKARGHQYRTGSDCESIIHAYEEFGEEFIHKLRGMYAFALYDTRKNRVILGRDRMGEKPLYLCERDGEIWFASELRSIMAGHLVPFELAPDVVNMYFHYAYVPEPRTPIVGVRKLEAGTTLTIDLAPAPATWNVQERRYWKLEDAPPIEGNPVEIIRAELDTIAELVCRSDVPVGVALSAGIDSSAVAALVNAKRPGQIHALSVGYPGRPKQDERHMAHRFANHIGMPFHDVEVSVREFVELFGERCLWRDDPIADAAGHGYYAVARLSHEKKIPVLLMGQGGDELFWGYPWAKQAAHLSRLKEAGTLNSPEQKRQRLRDRFPTSLSRRSIRLWAMEFFRRHYGYAISNPDERQPADRMVFYNAAPEFQLGMFSVPKIMNPAFLQRAIAGEDPGSLFTFERPWKDIGAQITSLICATYLRENGMVQGDRLSMVNSVELRLPFSDYRLAEVAVGLRKAHPDDHLEPKAHLKKALATLLPDWVMNRPKSGFTPPTKQWMPALQSEYGNTLQNGILVSRGILDRQACKMLCKPHFRFSPWMDVFYKALVLEFWAQGMTSIVTPPVRATP